MARDSNKNAALAAQQLARLSLPDRLVEEEDSPDRQALQAPTIDPVWFAALGLSPMGPVSAGNQLIQQVGTNAVLGGLSDAWKRKSQYLPRLSRDQTIQSLEDVETAGNDVPGPQHYGKEIRLAYPDSKVAKKLSEFLDKIFITPESQATKEFKEALEKLGQTGFEAPLP